MEWPFAPIARKSASLIMADPPWSFATFSPKGWGKSAQRHYGCMSMADIAALPVRDLAADNCLLWLWCTAPMLDQQISILKGWGARYVSSGAWVKTTKSGGLAFGTGYSLRNCHETYVLGAFGRPKIASRSVRSVIMAPVREHSRKPEQAYDAARALIPDGIAVELFSRASRDGWVSWGLESGKFDEAAA